MEVKINNGKDKYVKVQQYYEYDYIPCHSKIHSKPKKWYLDAPIFLDTETSHNHDPNNPIGWIYQWCFELNGQVVGGRKPSELVKIFKYIAKSHKLDKQRRILCFIHNASYDLTYLIPWLTEEDDDIEVLAVANHKIISFYVGGIEFRCSWKLSNMSLAQWGKKIGADIMKMVGAIDYDTIRYQNTRLTTTDWEYMVNDVLALKDAFWKDLASTGDNLISLPLTSTGYVRRDCRLASRKDNTYRNDVFLATRLEFQTYIDVHCAFQGGLTHGNRHLSAKTLTGKIKHGDFKSHYPSRQQLDPFVIEKYRLYFDSRNGGTMPLKELWQLVDDNYSCLIVISFYNMKLKKGITLPVISASKIINTSGYQLVNEAGIKGTDNGKVINVVGQIALVVTEIDLRWIISQYDIEEMRIIRCHIAKYGDFPKPLKDTINEYFKIKETLPDGVFRMKSKNKLNGIYGMTATDIVRTTFSLDVETGEWTSSRPTDEEITEQLDKYYNSRNSFLPYQYGMLTTAWARHWLLHIVANCIGYDHFIYCDTDSAFYYSTPEIEKKISDFNNWVVELNKSKGLGVKNRKGTISYYGTFEDEHDDIAKFRFLHAKCYCIEHSNGEMTLTVAGVTANNGYPKDNPLYMTREHELGSIDNLDEGFIFTECGGTKSVYTNEKPTIRNINGHRTEYASACIITNTTKQMGGVVEDFSVWEVDDLK